MVVSTCTVHGMRAAPLDWLQQPQVGQTLMIK
jgi:hypothetical protein